MGLYRFGLVAAAAVAAGAAGARRHKEGDAELCGPLTHRDTERGRPTTMSRRKGAGSRARARYVAAPWERQWALEIGWLESDEMAWDRGCAKIAAEVDKVRRWLTWVERRGDGRSPPADAEVLSGWADPGGCGGWAPIEPLVSHLRHPLFHCVGPNKDTFQLMFSKAYHVKALTRPEDYVAVKLDIDNNPVETALVRQLLDDPEALARVDEFFWEHHVWGSPLQKTRVDLFGTKNIGWGQHMPTRGARDSTLRDSYRIFTELRERGVRAHAWV